MKESFDPLAEAQRRSDPQLVRYNETIGHDPSANADYADYLRTRDFEDANGNIHDAKTSKFKKRDAGSDPYEADLMNSAHTEALEENTLRDSSLDVLAKKVAEARQSGDATAAAHAEDLFFDKFTKLSEKYGWEEDDDSVNDTLRVDKDAKVGRSTIDDRLARYSKIMYGEEADTAVNNPEVVAKEGTDKTDRTDNEPASAPEDQSDTASPAKANREPIARVSKDGLEDLEDSPKIPRVSTEGLEDDTSDNGTKIERVSTEGLEDDEVEPTSPAKNFLGRAKRALEKGRGLYLRAAFELGHTLDLAKQELSKRGGRKENETEEQYEKRMRRNGRNVALGIVALAGASLAAKAGAFDSLFDGNAHATGNRTGIDSGIEELLDPSRGGGEQPLSIDDSNLYSGDALRIDKGEGFYQTFREMGIPRDKWQEVMDKSGPKLVRMGEAYRDPSIGGFGLNGDGRLSERALRTIADTARTVK